jgi:hypothetical protein
MFSPDDTGLAVRMDWELERFRGNGTSTKNRNARWNGSKTHIENEFGNRNPGCGKLTIPVVVFPSKMCAFPLKYPIPVLSGPPGG